jgi:hypothetical protein
MAPFYATYDLTTASRVVRFRGRGRYSLAAVWDPPPGFTGARGVGIRKHGGKRHNPRDFSLGANTTAQMFTDVFGAYVMAYDCDPGGLWRGDAEEVDCEFMDESAASDALFPMFLGAHYADPYLVGSTRTVDPARNRWCAFGESSGAHDVARSQFVPLGGFGDLAAAESVRGGRQFRYHPDHRCGHAYLFIPQNRISSFNAYTTDPALGAVGSMRATTWVAKTTGGSNAAGANVLRLVGDTVQNLRCNRLRIVASAGATSTGSNLAGANVLQVTGGFPALRVGTFLRYNLGAGDVEHNVTAAYAGGAGSLSIFPVLAADVPPGTALQIRFDEAVTASAAAPGSSVTPVDVSVWPPLAITVPDGSPVELLHYFLEDYGQNGWDSGYRCSGNTGWTCATYPFEDKREADVDFLIDSGPNPRVAELNVMIGGSGGITLQRVDSLTDPRSWAVRHAGAPANLPERIDLHDECDAALLAHRLYLSGARVAAYLGTRETNPQGTDGSIPWLAGRNAQFSSSILAAFLSDPAARGGAFS